MSEVTLIIGAGGPSCSGKSTITSWLAQVLDNTIVVHQDKYFKSDSDIPITPSGIANWDCPQALDMEAFIQVLERLKTHGDQQSSIMGDNRSKLDRSEVTTESAEQFKRKISDACAELNIRLKIVLVDGFLLYHTTRIIDLLDIRLFSKANYETLKRRREERSSYITAEGCWVDPKGYFDEIVWPEYLRHNHLPLQTISRLHSLRNDSERQAIAHLDADSSELIDGLVHLDSEDRTIEQLLTQVVDNIVTHLKFTRAPRENGVECATV
ncbi:P-loop containing nucleoside triphosphate hydrolase protein [Polychytrium aggregatum]|uniref:P-loop containing nucleoside triphosphate hydrolase protein n=1 Tax=Polychytrium aggregatum TaxID=110093 RepID=UPI0022FE80F9|nr:P-loop containing nucleoside triphosphate hydrolase protein [Polychytrium aggregatum]KAI9202016.1 P-loop containing nucleoside triphosphate hydrolase protein [Polychytrium aggregatum]